MTEVTDEELARAGLAEFDGRKSPFHVTRERLMLNAYRAMRALEAGGARGSVSVDLAGQFANAWIRHQAPFTPTGERLERRLDALQVLVLVLAGRSEGYPPGDATLQRLIAELENAR